MEWRGFLCDKRFGKLTHVRFGFKCVCTRNNIFTMGLKQTQENWINKVKSKCRDYIEGMVYIMENLKICIDFFGGRRHCRLKHVRGVD